MRLTFLHDWLNQRGGAEDVLEVLKNEYPDAPIYTSIYAPEKLPASYREWEIHSTWLDKFPAVHEHHQWYLPFYPLAFRSLRLPACDVVLSNKSGFCIMTPKPAGAKHVCYCLAPSRYVYDLPGYLARERYPSWLAGNALALGWVRLMQAWERHAAQSVDVFLSISREIQQRVRDFYGRESEILYPPVDTARFAQQASADGGYFLIVSRLIPYKALDLAVQTCSKLKLPLRIAGRGRDEARLRAMAGDTVEFLGYVPDAELPGLMANCRALLFPGREDFGITPIQAMSAGRPVIAFQAGGALDYVVPGKTGAFFPNQNADSLMECLLSFSANEYDPVYLRQFALQFDKTHFIQRLNGILNSL